MNTKPLKIGLVGYGLAGRVFHTPLYEAAGVELVAVVTSKPENVLADHPAVRIYETPAQLLKDDEIDLVVLASPSFTHAPLMLEALAAGKHVLSDKPFTATVTEADAVIAASKKAGKIASCYQNRRYDADFLTLQSLMEQQVFGEVLHFEAHFDRYSPIVKDRWQEYEQPGVGIHYDLGAHLVDQALTLFGLPDWVQADVQKQREGSAIIDQFYVRLAKGRIRLELSAGMLVPDNRLRYRVHGTKGSWFKEHLDPQEDQIWHQAMKPTDERYGLEDESHYGILTTVEDGRTVSRRTPTLKGDWPGIYRDFASAIQQGVEPPVTGEQARNTIAVIEAMVASSDSGQRVSLVA
ncbi:MAG: Gfo/Idh/MocA family oxidoreductase [Granulosicoccus sp.]